MKKLLFVTAVLLAFVVPAAGQNLTGQTLTLRGYRVDSIGRNDLLTGATYRQIATTLAVKNYVDAAILSGSFGGPIAANRLLGNPTGSTAAPVAFGVGSGLGFSGGLLVNTGDTDGSNDITTASTGAGDVSGTFPTLTVIAIRGNPVAATAPTTGNVLQWNGTAWTPATVSTGVPDYEEFDNISGTNLTPITASIPATEREWRINLYRTGVRLTYLKDFTISGGDIVLAVAAQAEDFVLIVNN